MFQTATLAHENVMQTAIFAFRRGLAPDRFRQQAVTLRHRPVETADVDAYLFEHIKNFIPAGTHTLGRRAPVLRLI
jgi:hypothetical protein